jgi:hypothetical protein
MCWPVPVVYRQIRYHRLSLESFVGDVDVVQDVKAP